MSVARVTEIIAASPKSFEDAVQVGIARANKTLQNVKSAWIEDQKVDIEDGKITGISCGPKGHLYSEGLDLGCTAELKAAGNSAFELESWVTNVM